MYRYPATIQMHIWIFSIYPNNTGLNQIDYKVVTNFHDVDIISISKS